MAPNRSDPRRRFALIAISGYGSDGDRARP